MYTGEVGQIELQMKRKKPFCSHELEMERSVKFYEGS
jgi:hypothetical protein